MTIQNPLTLTPTANTGTLDKANFGALPYEHSSDAYGSKVSPYSNALPNASPSPASYRRKATSSFKGGERFKSLDSQKATSTEAVKEQEVAMKVDKMRELNA